MRSPGLYREDVYPSQTPAMLTGVPAFIGVASTGPVASGATAMTWSRLEELAARSLELPGAGSPLNAAEQLELERLSATAKLDAWPGGLSAIASGQWSSAGQMLRVESLASFTARFGSAVAGTFLTDAVRAFFLNGGAVCYVVRLDPSENPYQAFSDALAAVRDLSEVDLVCAPDPMHASRSDDVVLTLQQSLVDFCEVDGPRMAVLDASPGATSTGVISQCQALTGTNAALYYPWLRPPPDASGPRPFVPPCGHVAGVIAATDATAGPYRAPANVALSGVLDLEVDVTSVDQEPLNDAGANVIRSFPGRGIRIWGARTLSANSAWLYVSVRRVFLTAARWIAVSFDSPVFEPSDPGLWRRIELQLTAYFSDLFQQGALKGATPAEAFFVRCDEMTNTSDARDHGQVVAEIGLAPAVPNEFVVVRITRSADGVSIAGPSPG